MSSFSFIQIESRIFKKDFRLTRGAGVWPALLRPIGGTKIAGGAPALLKSDNVRDHTRFDELFAIKLSGSRSETLAARRQRKVNVRVGVSRGNERCFELGRREEHASIERTAEEFGKATCVAFFRRRV